MRKNEVGNGDFAYIRRQSGFLKLFFAYLLARSSLTLVSPFVAAVVGSTTVSSDGVSILSEKKKFFNKE